MALAVTTPTSPVTTAGSDQQDSPDNNVGVAVGVAVVLAVLVVVAVVLAVLVLLWWR